METTLHGERARFEGGLREVAQGVFAYLQPNGGWGESNAGLVIGEGEALLVDTLWDPRLTQGLLDAVLERAPEAPIRTLVNTHSDGDHVWGNQLLEGAEIVATDAAAEIVRSEQPGGLQRFRALAPRLRPAGRLPLPAARRAGRLGAYVAGMLGPFDFSEVRVTPPTRTFTGEETLGAGGREVRLIEVGPAHTPGDLIAHVPDARVVFAADVMFVGVLPVMWAGPTENWLAAIDRILALDPQVIVPGHGPVCGRDEALALRSQMAWTQEEATARLEAGRTPLEAARELVDDMRSRGLPWAAWDQPERLAITVETIDRHRRGAAGPVSARERARIFGEVAELAHHAAGG